MSNLFDWFINLSQLKKILGHTSNSSYPAEIMSDEILLKKLKILSKIPANGRLCVYPDETIALEQESSLQGAKRLLSGDNRNKTVDTIRKIIEQACVVAGICMDHKYMEIYMMKTKQNESAIQQHNQLVDRLNTLKKELRNSKNGINNLRDTTYSEDASIVSELEIIVDKIDMKIDEIEKKIYRVHDRYVKKDVSDGSSTRTQYADSSHNEGGTPVGWEEDNEEDE